MSLWPPCASKCAGEQEGEKPGAPLPQRPLGADAQIKRFNRSHAIVRRQHLTHLPLPQIRKKRKKKIPSSFPNCLSKGTKLENETEPLTNKITRCLHLVAAIKALMTSEDAILMHRRRRRRLSFFGPLCRLLSSVTDGFGMCHVETSVIKSASQSDAVVSATPIVGI